MNNSKVHACIYACYHGNNHIFALQNIKIIRMFILALSLILSLVAGFSPADTQANRSCSVCNCQLKNDENLIGFIDNRVQTLVQNILNSVLADQPSKNHKIYYVNSKI